MADVAHGVKMMAGNASLADDELNSRDDAGSGFRPDVIPSLNSASQLMGFRKASWSPDHVSHPFETLSHSTSDRARHPFETLSPTSFEQETPPDHLRNPIENISSILHQVGPPLRGKTFPELLYLMLEELEARGESNIVSWQPHGRSFRVHSKKDFVSYIMPRYFHQTKWTSFQRQLNLYNFRRIAERDADAACYYHHRFLKGRQLLSRSIRRQGIKGNKGRVSVQSKREPPNSFFALPYMVVDETKAPPPKLKSDDLVKDLSRSTRRQGKKGRKGRVSVKSKREPPNSFRVLPYMVVDDSQDHVQELSFVMPYLVGAQELPPDDLPAIRDLFKSMGKPINLDDLDDLPMDAALEMILD